MISGGPLILFLPSQMVGTFAFSEEEQFIIIKRVAE